MTEQEEFEFRHRLEQEQAAKPQGSALGTAPAVALADASLGIGSGMVAAPVAGIAGALQGVKNLVSPGMEAGDRVRQVQDALTFQPRTPGGRAIVGAVSAPFEKLAQGGNAAGEFVADQAAKVLPAPVAAGLGAGANTLVQSAPQLIGKGVRAPLGRAALLERTKAEVDAKLNAPRDADIKAAREAGYVLPPAEANPNLLNRILEGFSGQAKVQQLASAKNQPVTNAIVRKGLGIAPDAPITMEVLQDVRKEAGKTFQKVRDIGDIQTGPEYAKALDQIEAKYKGAAESFPEETSAVESAVKSARVDQFKSNAAVDKINIERARADKAFRQGDSDLGKAHKAIADAIEDQIEKHLETNGGDPALLSELRKSRQIIAKSYDVQKALKGNDVDARVLAQQLRKGRPISGELQQVAKLGDRFPGAAQTGGRNAYTPTYFDAMGGLLAGGGMLLHQPEMGAAALTAAAATAARPAIRGAILTRPYQMMTERNYGPGFKTLAELAASDPALIGSYFGQGEGNFQRLKDAQ